MMNIFFDLGLDNPINYTSLNLDGDAKIIIDEIANLIKERLKDLEHLMSEEPTGYILVNIGKPEIRYYYSQDLGKRLNDMIPEEYYRQITTKLYYYLNRQ